MAVYTVHEPPLRAADALRDPECFVFVRDGFYFWAFVIAALWMLWHRMRLALLIYFLMAAGLETAMHYAGASAVVVAVVALLLSLLVGIEAGTLRRFTLSRRGWRHIGVVSGDDLEDAERRFFDAWVRQAPQERAEPPPVPQSAAVSPRMPRSPGVIGLFPEPGASR